jgi:2-keto-4-pentenoate hydratase/2-oxohepta-3-ene-1,7-dioic acid hydratase in catechol pathway
MRFARIDGPAGATFAVQAGDRWDAIVDPFSEIVRTGYSVAFGSARLLAPVDPRVVVGMARNGSREQRAKPPAAFLKSVRTVIGPHGPVAVDTTLGEAIIEGELAIIIGRPAHSLSEHNALDAVLGYTIANDVTASAQALVDPVMTQAKNGSGFTPLGPVIDTEFDPFDARISVTVNGRVVARASTAQLARNVVEQLVYVSRFVQLDAGDVILTGCPGTAHPIVPGDHFTVSIEGLGSLTNTAV